MGSISNLITDMTVMGADTDEIVRAVKHSMVIIDSEKHHLNYKASYDDFGIAELQARYQPNANGGRPGGASTLLSRSTSEQRVLERKIGTGPFTAEQKAQYSKTGEKVFRETGNTYSKKHVDKKTGEVTWTTHLRETKSTKGYETNDARTLMSGPNNEGTKIEQAYAEHANKLKALANQARKEAYLTKNPTYSPSAKKTYASEVETLNKKLVVAYANKPLERAAQNYANTIITQKRQANPGLSDGDVKKIKYQALAEGRARMGADKHKVEITMREWEAIQARAVSNNTLVKILNNTDLDKVKNYATPKSVTTVSAAKVARAKAMLANGATQAEVAAALGIPKSTLMDNVKGVVGS
jgi:hypothetical protein